MIQANHIRLSHIRQDWQAAGATNRLIGLHSFVDERTFLTKAGELGIVFQLTGIDAECLDHPQRDQIARRFEAAVRSLDERFRLLQYFTKESGVVMPATQHANPVVQEAINNRAEFLAGRAAQLYEVNIHFVLLMKPAERHRGYLSWRRTAHAIDASVLKASEELGNKAESLAIQLGELLGMEILNKAQAFLFLRRLLNFASARRSVGLKYDLHLDYFACDANIECHRDHLRIDDRFVQVLTLKEPPASTFAQVLHGLEGVPCDLILCSTWQREPNDAIRREIHAKRRHFHNSKASMTNYIGDKPANANEMLIDESAGGLVAELGECLRELEINGNTFGRFSFTIVLIAEELATVRRAASECVKALTTHDAHVLDERYNLLNAYLSIVPGNQAFNLRELWLMSTNYADLSFLFAPRTGERWNAHLKAEHLAVLETPSATPYCLNLHVQDVAHTLILGATGSGKSFLLNFLITNLQKYDPITYIFDLGGSYEHLTRLFGGSYLAVGLERQPFQINPFRLDPTPENLHFLAAFVRVLVESGGYRLTTQDERDVYEQITNLYELDPQQRRLFTLSNILRRGLAQHLYRWIQGGQFAAVFDNVHDTLTFARFQTLDFEGMDRHPQVLEPLLFYVLHRANASIYDPALSTTFKTLVLDEAWRFFNNETIRAYVTEAVKTWRKRNAAVILATQSSDDLRHSDILRAVVESCPTKMFLANPGMDRETYQALFHLNDTEAQLIARLTPKQQILIARPDYSKVVNLNVDSVGYWLYTSNPFDAQRRREAFEAYGFHEGLKHLARRPA
ncbi:MAG: DUF87 domain-containing protein [Acidobacteria bacterium]|nr:DUF87 domain-containing protein [Acidobacteriota bacterium]